MRRCLACSSESVRSRDIHERNGRNERRSRHPLNRGHLRAVAVAHAPIGDVALEVLASSGLAVDRVAFGVAPVRGVHEEVRIGDAEVELLAHRLDQQACERAPDDGDPEADERGRQLVERLNDRRRKDAMCILAGGCYTKVHRARACVFLSTGWKLGSWMTAQATTLASDPKSPGMPCKLCTPQLPSTQTTERMSE